MSKVEKIHEEIKKRYEYWKEKESNSHSIESESRMSECNHLLSMIISLSDTEKDFGIKESIIPFGASDSELMEATYFIPQGYHAVIESNKVIIKKGEEPVSNDLEEAATKYARKQLSNPDYPTYNDEYEMECAFKAGAQWQKQQDQSTIELAEDHAYLAGQEKIIAKACEWLENYFKGVSSGTVYLEDFKKAMEE